MGTLESVGRGVKDAHAVLRIRSKDDASAHLCLREILLSVTFVVVEKVSVAKDSRYPGEGSKEDASAAATAPILHSPTIQLKRL